MVAFDPIATTTLIAVGLEGGAELAQWVGTPACSGCRSHVECLDDLGAPCDCPCHFPELRGHGLDGVRGIGLVGVTAPWAELVKPAWAPCGLLKHDGSCGCKGHIPLGPLEPLRAVAEMAANDVCRPCGGEGSGPCGDCGGRGYPLRLIIACAPDDGVCKTCGGDGLEVVPSAARNVEITCHTCSGTGKALSSADVARELSGYVVDSPGILVHNFGGLRVDFYPTRDDLAAHGLRTVVEELMR